MNITIVGAGNVGTQFAVHCAEKGHRVTMYSSKPERISKALSIVDENGRLLHTGRIVGGTSDAAAAFSNAEVIFVTMPAYCMAGLAEKILPYAGPGMKIGLVPGTGGGECSFRACVNRGAVLFGLQRVPSVARLVEYGKCVKATGYRDELHVAAIPHCETDACGELIMDLLDRPCVSLPNYLTLTMTPSNPIIHTTRLRILFQNYREGVVYDRVPLFYEEWDDETSELLLSCDEEVQRICRELKEFDLSYVKSLRVHYESWTKEALTSKIRSIAGFKGIGTPMVKVDGGYIPDLNSRYFTADFPYGLSLLVQIADFTGVDVPYMRETLEWYYSIIGNRKDFRFGEYGVCDLKELTAFYSI